MLVALASVVFGAIAPATAPAAAADCADIRFIGARGSGEPGPGTPGWAGSLTDPASLGPRLQSVLTVLQQQLAGQRSVSWTSVEYPAAPVSALIGRRLPEYFLGLEGGVQRALTDIRTAAAACPRQHFVLAGYSQGSMAMHRVLRAMSQRTLDRDALSRVDAAVLIADGDKVQYDSVNRYGTAGANARGIGLAWRAQSGSSPVKLPAAVGARVHSVCNRNDMVCDFHGWNIVNGVSTHLKYRGTPEVLAAANAAARAVLAVPLTSSGFVVAARVGEPLSYQLTAQVGAGYTLDWRRPPGAEPLPPGIALSPAGALTGTPTEAGTFVTKVQVRSVVLGVPGQWVGAALQVDVQDATGSGNGPDVEVLSLERELHGELDAGPDGSLWGMAAWSPVADHAQAVNVDLLGNRAETVHDLPPTCGGIGVGSELAVTLDGALWYDSDCQGMWRKPEGSSWANVTDYGAYPIASPDGSIWMNDGGPQRITADGDVHHFSPPEGFDHTYWRGVTGVDAAGAAWAFLDYRTVDGVSGQLLMDLRPDGSMVQHDFPYADEVQAAFVYPRPDGSLWWVGRHGASGASRAGIVSSDGNFGPAVQIADIASWGTGTVDNAGRLWLVVPRAIATGGSDLIRVDGDLGVTTSSIAELTDNAMPIFMDLVTTSTGLVVGLANFGRQLAVITP
ncbi:MAG: cutinase [Blastococcus sp.]|jgi:hypothetical protein|nr:cutinase [Blastococcus sp.]